MAIGDQYFSNVVLACSFDSAFVDESFSANTITAYGNVVISATQSKFGGKSAYFDGTGDYLSITANSLNAFLLDDFTIEGWININGISSPTLFESRSSDFVTTGFTVYIRTTGKLTFGTGNPFVATEGTTTVTTGVWHHVAIVRSSGVVKGYLNGIQELSVNNTANLTATSYIIGSNVNISTSSAQYIDDLRITKGVARYTANFTPPTSANPLYYGQVQGTVRDSTGNYAQRIVRAHRRSDGVVMGETLSNPSTGSFTINTPTAEKVYTLVQDHDAWITYLPFNGENNSTVFEEWNGKQVTPYGNAKISTVQSKFGEASAYFDGVGDALSIQDSENFHFQDKDFTIEAWVNPDYVSVIMDIFSNRASTGTQEFYGIRINNGGALRVFAISNSSSVTDITTSAILSAGVWSHIAVVRYYGVVSIYINGTYAATTGINLTLGWPTPATLFYIGTAHELLNSPYKGYIDDLKISKGKAQYTTNFTPPTQPHFTTQEGDPYWNNVVLGCHFDGYVDNGDPYRNEVVLNMRMNALTDDTGKAVTIVGNTNISTSIKKYGSGSVYFDGTGEYLTTPDSDDWSFGSGDFTIECWVYHSVLKDWSMIITQRSSVSSNYSFDMYTTAAGHCTLGVSYTGTAWSTEISTGAGQMVADAWQHIAVQRRGSNLDMYLDGVRKNTSSAISTNSLHNSSVNLMIGADAGGSMSFNGYIDDLRITKGIARYTTDFTPPTAELPIITGSKWIDSATSKTITPYGNAVISATQSKFGGYSAYFDGSKDYLSIPYSADFVLPNSGFTIEAWVYIITNSSQDGTGMRRAAIFGTANSGATSYIIFQIDGNSTTTGTGFILEYTVSGNGHSKAAICSITQNTWHHVAICADNSSTRFYLDGVVYITTAISVPMVFNAAGAVWVGRASTLSTWERYFPGYIDDLRITKGIARYTADFTPPNAAFYNNKSDTDSAKYNALIYDMVVPA